MKFHFLIACHNRRDLTVRAIRAVLLAAKGESEVSFTVFDDGSSDGTAAALADIHADIHLLVGDGSAFWARGMSLVEQSALLRASAADWLVWLNDDVDLDIDALTRVRAYLHDHSRVLVASMRDPVTGETTYGGYEKYGVHPLRYRPVRPTSADRTIDAFNGNLVFVPVTVARQVGGIDGEYSHALADIDYGQRVRRAEVPLILLPGSYGECPRNLPEENDGLWNQWRRYVGVKGGGNMHSLARILKKNSRVLWPVFLATSYTLWWIRTPLRRMMS